MTRRRDRSPAAAAEAPRAKGSTSDDDDFAREMRDVVPLRPDPRGRVRAAPRIIAPRDARSTPDPVDTPDSDFAARGVDRREIRKLKQGKYRPGGRCDLHGKTADEARDAVEHFIDRSRHRGYRCVCIVHGRGMHSGDNVPVLKPCVRACLRSHPSVLAYADAPPSDGGAGAVYVLLRMC